jgi:hypothetical protein
MLKILQLSNFTIAYQDFEKNGDYNIRISFKPNLDDPVEAKFGFQYGLILYPHLFGQIDTTINDDDYYCYILYDDLAANVQNSPYPYFAYFKKKLEKDINEITPNEPAKVAQGIDERIGVEFRALKGPTGETGVNLGSDVLEMVAGDNRMVISNKGISFYGEVTNYRLPTDSMGGIFQQTGIMHLIPDVPPFGQIKYVPNSSMLMRVSSILNLVKIFQQGIGG